MQRTVSKTLAIVVVLSALPFVSSHAREQTPATKFLISTYNKARPFCLPATKSLLLLAQTEKKCSEASPPGCFATISCDSGSCGICYDKELKMYCCCSGQ
jgi:hypothetical protein